MAILNSTDGSNVFFTDEFGTHSVPLGAVLLAALQDVEANAPNNGDTLVFNAAAKMWLNSPSSGGGVAPLVLTPITAAGAVNPSVAANYIITPASAIALTLSAPVAGLPSAGGDDGKIITIQTNTPGTATLTTSGLFDSGFSASVNLASFAAFAGALIVIMAYQARWKVRSLNGVTMS